MAGTLDTIEGRSGLFPRAYGNLAIFRTVSQPIDMSSYNVQELGLGRALTKAGYNVDVFSVSPTGSFRETVVLQSQTARLRYLEISVRNVPLVEQVVFREVLHAEVLRRYSLVHVNESNEFQSFLTARLARKLDIPIVLYQGMYQPIGGRAQKLFQTLFDRLCLPSLARNTTVPLGKTKRAADFLRTRGFANPRVLPVGLDPTPFQDPVQIDWRKRLGIPEQAEMLTYVGKVERRRRADLLVEVARRFSSRNVAVVIVGCGPDKLATQNYARQQNISNVYFCDAVSQRELPSLYQQSTLFLLPTTYEIYGMAILESMFFGLPVISSAAAGPESIIENEVDGWLVNDLDVDRWTCCISNAIDDKRRLEAVAVKAKTKVNESLTWDRIAERYINLAKL